MCQLIFFGKNSHNRKKSINYTNTILEIIIIFFFCLFLRYVD